MLPFIYQTVKVMWKKTLLLIVCLSCLLRSTAQNLKFDKLTVAEGLTSVNSILVDRKGFTWFGGTHGLYRFDGTDFRSWHHNPQDENSLSSDHIISLFEDGEGNIWIGTENHGINIFNWRLESLQRVSFQDESVNHSSVLSFFQDPNNGNVWMGTSGRGIYIVDRNFNISDHYIHQRNSPGSLSNNTVFDMLRDREGRIWVSTNSGKLDQFNNGDFIHFDYESSSIDAVRTGQKMIEDAQGRIWLGTEGKGLFIFDPQAAVFEVLDNTFKTLIPGNTVLTALDTDAENNIWMSTDGSGIFFYEEASKKLTKYRHQRNNPHSLSNDASYSLAIDHSDRAWFGMGDGTVNITNYIPFGFFRSPGSLSFDVVVDLLMDRQGRIWAGTGGGGISVIQPDGALRVLDNNSSPALNSNIILTLKEDSKGNIWSGSFLGGVDKIDPDGNSVQHYTEEDGLSNNHVFALEVDPAGTIWIGTQGGGLNFITPNGNIQQADFIEEARIQSLMVDSNRRLWVGLYSGGVKVYDLQKRMLLNAAELLGDSLVDRKLKEYPVHSFEEGNSGDIWIGTGGMGIVRVGEETKTYTTSDGLPSNSIYGVLTDKHTAWISTNKGIASISIAAETISTLNISDGLTNSDFESGGIIQSDDGMLYFSSKDGIVYFHPGSLPTTRAVDRPVLTDLQIHNTSVVPKKEYAGTSILSESITTAASIDLPYSQNNFTIYFNSPTFRNPDRVHYRYKLEGFDEDWITDENGRHFVPYSNLRDRDYTFHVQGSLDRRDWSASRSIAIKVYPPFFRAWYAYLSYALLLLVVSYFGYWFIKGRIKLRNQLKFEKFTREREKELNEQKINFFTGVSHELRTPLTLLIGPLEQLSNNSKIENRVRNQIMMMQRNANKLLSLVNQLLDFRKMESGQLQLKVSQQDMVYFIEEILLTFREIALQKNIKLTFRNDLKTRNLFFDETKIEIALFNLLSNAIKYTDADGTILLAAGHSKDGSEVIIEVTDTGFGIRKENLNKIFDPFYRDRTIDKNESGSGIGLTLTKNVIELHHGNIEVQSEVNEGTSFFIRFPIAENSYLPSEHFGRAGADHNLNIKPQPGKPTHVAIAEELPILLIVEDNQDIRLLLKDVLAQQFRIYEVVDGSKGLEMAFEIIPDVILSDIMMPVMDGVKLCRELKSDLRTSHIPVILLTARSGFTHELSGLTTGADDYITKPFQIEILVSKINNILENRKKLRKKIEKDFLLEPSAVAITDPDEVFLKDLMDQVNSNLSNSEYSVKDLAAGLGISHSVLYRKVNSLTGLTINDLIKTIRLKKAAQLLESKAFNISEVGYQVGFSNPKYFSTCFKAEYGLTPSQYLGGSEKHKKES